MNKKISSSIAIAAIIILAVLVGGLVFWQSLGISGKDITEESQSQLKEPASGNKDVALKDKTPDWKTYRNEEYGLEFQYPSNWEKEELSSSGGMHLIIGAEENNKYYNLDIQIYDNSDKFNIEELFEDLLKRSIPTDGPGYCYNIKRDEIEGFPVIKCNVPVSNFAYTELVIFLNNVFIYEFSFPEIDENNHILLNSLENNKKVYQMLSTFKFLD